MGIRVDGFLLLLVSSLWGVDRTGYGVGTVSTTSFPTPRHTPGTCLYVFIFAHVCTHVCTRVCVHLVAAERRELVKKNSYPYLIYLLRTCVCVAFGGRIFGGRAVGGIPLGGGVIGGALGSSPGPCGLSVPLGNDAPFLGTRTGFLGRGKDSDSASGFFFSRGGGRGL